MKGPVKFTETPGPAPTPAPTFGQHSDEILAGCGYSADESRSVARLSRRRWTSMSSTSPS
jgi:crotonobetainyl-CoA:carnitine CoA-transferase CaiB-like acyl-CoA transferase